MHWPVFVIVGMTVIGAVGGAVLGPMLQDKAVARKQLIDHVEEWHRRYREMKPGYILNPMEGPLAHKIELAASANLLRNRLRKLGYNVSCEGWTEDDESLQACFQLLDIVRSNLA